MAFACGYPSAMRSATDCELLRDHAVIRFTGELTWGSATELAERIDTRRTLPGPEERAAMPIHHKVMTIHRIEARGIRPA